jgi:trimethylamine--corrinoid protein Co-methyltransferase
MRLEVFDHNQVQAVNQASLDILENAGATFLSANARRIFANAGATVDESRQNVRIPSYLVKELIKNVPNTLQFYGTDPSRTLEIGGTKQYMTCGGHYQYVLDLEKGNRRPGIRTDVENLTRLGDALENISVASGMVRANDVPEEILHVEDTVIHWKNTSKPGYIYGETAEAARDSIELLRIIAGGEAELRKKPVGTAAVCPSSPLMYDTKLTDFLTEVAQAGLPVLLLAMDNSGATSPVTLAGTITQTNAVLLAGICLVQIIQKGGPVLYGSIPLALDQRTGLPSVGSPEQALLSAGNAQMARYYGFPSAISAGVSDSKIPDIQAGYESALTMIAAMLAGANWIRTVAGALESHTSACYEMLVIHDEMFGMAERIARGIEVSDQTLATSLIKKVAPARGNYLGERHTLDFLRQERYLPKLSDRSTRNVWEKGGSKSLREVARAKAKEILGTHWPKPLAPETERELDKKAEEIRKRVMAKKP